MVCIEVLEHRMSCKFLHVRLLDSRGRIGSIPFWLAHFELDHLKPSILSIQPWAFPISCSMYHPLIDWCHCQYCFILFSFWQWEFTFLPKPETCGVGIIQNFIGFFPTSTNSHHTFHQKTTQIECIFVCMSGTHNRFQFDGQYVSWISWASVLKAWQLGSIWYDDNCL
jgi:hypothetical protein